MIQQNSVSKISSISARASKFSDIVVGKDILELLSHAMYVNPLTIYREYIQNSADAIDEAETFGCYKRKEPRIEIATNQTDRSIKIHDNGSGIKKNSFKKRITAFGASKKRGSNARGFRGVGRLAGLGYCQKLIFRTKFKDELETSEVSWDCRKILELLRDNSFKGDLNSVVSEATSFSTNKAKNEGEHFFEVELKKVSRLKNDILLNDVEIANYLSQIAPVPFSKDFRFGAKIYDFLSEFNLSKTFDIFLNGSEQPLSKPHKNSLQFTDTLFDCFKDVHFFSIPDNNGCISAVGWQLDHNYLGAIPNHTGVKGLRLRVGNIQVGSSDIVADIFPERRFNSWAVGEIHVINKKLVPNGRRDNLVENIHYSNLLNHLSLQARNISKSCRTHSIARNRKKEFETERKKVEESISVLKQGALPKAQTSRLQKDVGAALSVMEKITTSIDLIKTDADDLKIVLQDIKLSAEKITKTKMTEDPLGNLPSHKKSAYKEIFGLIYDCSPNKIVAKSLIDKILSRIKLIN